MNGTTTQNPTFTISRTFNAPLALVWRVYTQAEDLMQWWGPTGVTMQVANLDLRPGGHFHYSYALPDGNVMWGIFRYQEVVERQRLVFTSGFSNEEGAIVRAPFSPDFPLEILNTVAFSEEAGKTTIDMQGTPYRAEENERAFFARMFASMQQGFTGTLDRLEAHLAKIG